MCGHVLASSTIAVTVKDTKVKKEVRKTTHCISTPLENCSRSSSNLIELPKGLLSLSLNLSPTDNEPSPVFSVPASLDLRLSRVSFSVAGAVAPCLTSFSSPSSGERRSSRTPFGRPVAFNPRRRNCAFSEGTGVGLIAEETSSP